jgi:hypothetical protein
MNICPEEAILAAKFDSHIQRGAQISLPVRYANLNPSAAVISFWIELLDEEGRDVVFAISYPELTVDPHSTREITLDVVVPVKVPVGEFYLRVKTNYLIQLGRQTEPFAVVTRVTVVN